MAEFGIEEMFVHCMGAAQKLAEVFGTDGHHHRKTDGRPDGVASADPVEHTEYAFGGDTEFNGGADIAGNGAEVVGNAFFRQAVLQVPVAGRLSVEQGFRRTEGFAGNAEYGCFRVECRQGLSDVGIVGVADEMHAHAGTVKIECLCAHLRP